MHHAYTTPFSDHYNINNYDNHPTQLNPFEYQYPFENESVTDEMHTFGVNNNNKSHAEYPNDFNPFVKEKQETVLSKQKHSSSYQVHEINKENFSPDRM